MGKTYQLATFNDSKYIPFTVVKENQLVVILGYISPAKAVAVFFGYDSPSGNIGTSGKVTINLSDVTLLPTWINDDMLNALTHIPENLPNEQAQD